MIINYEQLLDEVTTEEQEQELISFIFDNTKHISAESFSKDNLNYYDALDIVQSEDSYVEDVTEFLSNQHDSIVLEELISAMSMKDLAYYLAYSNTAKGTELLKELKYFESQGRLDD